MKTNTAEKIEAAPVVLDFDKAFADLMKAANKALPTLESLQNVTKATLEQLCDAGESFTEFCEDFKASAHWPKKEDGEPMGEKSARDTAAGLVLNRLKAAAAKYEMDSKGRFHRDDKGELAKKQRAPKTGSGEGESDGVDVEHVDVETLAAGVKAETVKTVMIAIREEFDREIASASKEQAVKLQNLLKRIDAKVADAVIL